ncbi:hypothetical protein N7478_009714 [Penicillium angulare]|uniref:uncharacterized protein n=1 Tax=Penicillium angulare TaxID=116970 RepID=UPI00253FC538|nr:uncharacterized protein N7478_009714 [Penicillium angulare]KAJ5266906.1 hypothetical protein N7478_009714 [Penicillium angulare]
MRTRSQPISPGGFQSLDDKPRRRRATRSASVTEEPEPTEQTTTAIQPKPAASNRPGRPRKGTTSKKTARKSKVAQSHAPAPEESSSVPTEQLEASTAERPLEMQDLEPSTNTSHLPNGTPSRRDRLLGPRQATPIARRSRASYSDISSRRRKDAGGRVAQTLFRLPDLVDQALTAEPTTPGRRAFVTEDAATAVAFPSTPAQNQTTPTAPKTAPAAGQRAEPGASASTPRSWSRWIFNSVSRRWSTIRGRIGPRNPDDAEPEADEEAAADEEVEPPTTPTATSTAVVAVEPADTLVPSGSVPRRMRKRAKSNYTYSLRPAGFSEELLTSCYSRMRTTPANTDDDDSKKRKREPSPESIPNPPGCSYGLNDEFFEFDSDDEKWAEEEQARRDALAQETAPSAAKKQRVDNPQPKRRRHVLHQSTPRKAEERPGYNANRPTRLYQATDLSAVESSEFLSEGENGPYVTQNRIDNRNTAPIVVTNPHGTFRTPGWDSSSDPVMEETPFAPPRHEAEASSPANGMFSNPGFPSSPPEIYTLSPDLRETLNRNGIPQTRRRIFPYPHAMDATLSYTEADLMNEEASPSTSGPGNETQDPNDDNTTDATRDASTQAIDPSPLSRARNKAEQFKPKTPSRLREAHRFPSSTPNSTASPSYLKDLKSTPSLFSDPMSMDGSSYLKPAVSASGSATPSATPSAAPATPVDAPTISRAATTAGSASLASAQNPPTSTNNSLVGLDFSDIGPDWLRYECPSGSLNQLMWPNPTEITEVLHSEAKPTVSLKWEQRNQEAVNCWLQQIESESS